MAQALGPRPPTGSSGRLILIQRYRDLLPLSLYLPDLHFLRRPGADVTQLDVISISAPRVPLCWWGAACNLSPSTLQRSYPIPGFRVAWRRRARPVHDPAAGRRASGRPDARRRRAGAQDDAAVERRPPVSGLAPAACRAAISFAVSSRCSPGARSPSSSGPNRTRTSDRTGCPTASHIRLTCRLRPSWIVSSSVVGRRACAPARGQSARRRAPRPGAVRAEWRPRIGVPATSRGRSCRPRSAGG